MSADRDVGVLLVSFGGPEGPDDVMPFLRNVTRGRGIPEERLAEVARHYLDFGGVSPINEQNARLRTAIETELAGSGHPLPVFWGNRNWDPYLAQAFREMRAAGIGRALAFVTSAYASYSGCRQYRENLADAHLEVGEGAPRIEKLRHYFDHPGFVEPFVDSTLAALRSLPPQVQDGARLVFTTHSIPLTSAETSGPDGWAYVAQHRAAATLVASGVSAATGVIRDWDLVYQSRSGPPTQPWLEPDIVDHLEDLVAKGVPGVVLVPVGFVSDHLEVVYDLDTQARERAHQLGLPLARAATPGTAPDPRFVGMVRDLVLERLESAPKRALSPLGPAWDVCLASCCPNPRGPRPALAEAAGS